MGKFEDLTGQTFGEWNVLSYLGESYWLCKSTITGEEKRLHGYKLKNGKVASTIKKQNMYLKLHDKYNEWEIIEIIDTQHYRCRCSCGKSERIILKYDLVNGRTKSCGHDSEKAFKDLTGQQFGDWKVLEYAGNRMWKCQCQCKLGTIRNVHGYSLISGKSTSCGHSKLDTTFDMQADKQLERGKKFGINLGDKFGDWVVIGDVDENFKIPCMCSCGKNRLVNIYTLKNGKSTGCGHNKNKDRLRDLTGEHFGDLVVKRYLGDSLWECECLCGKIVVKHRDHLLDNRATSCGHGTNKEPIDLVGKQYGKLKVLKYMGHKAWLCKCECGNEKVILGANLRNNSTLSCGCIQYRPTKEELVEKSVNFLNEYGRRPSITDLANYLDISYKVMEYHLLKYELTTSEYIDTKYKSQGERAVYDFIRNNYKNEIKHNVRNIIPPYELDIYIPDKKLAIEFNGTYWHNDENKDTKYHQTKTFECAKKGIHLIHIFEHEWKNEYTCNKIKTLILREICPEYGKVLYARNLKVVEISNNKAKNFYEMYHINCGIDSSINIALLDNNEIVGAMSFSSPRFDKKYDWELTRLAFKNDVKVTGGSEKLFKYFIDKYNPNTLVSYCDLSKFNGRIYGRLGFKCISITDPGYIWVNERSTDVLSRYQTMKSNLVAVGLGNEDQTEDDIMRQQGYYKIYNCGNLKFEWCSYK